MPVCRWIQGGKSWKHCLSKDNVATLLAHARPECIQAGFQVSGGKEPVVTRRKAQLSIGDTKMANPQARLESEAGHSVTEAVAEQVVVLTDARGRKLKVRPLDVLYESQLTRMFGTETAANLPYMMGFVYPAASVCEIDGVAYPRPTSQKEVDEAIERLGREGFAAFLHHMQSEMERIKQMVETSTETKLE